MDLILVESIDQVLAEALPGLRVGRPAAAR
jgi:hypothetical protein